MTGYPATLERSAHGGRDHAVLLDRENLATVEVGCFVCEAIYGPDTMHTVCPGDPVR